MPRRPLDVAVDDNSNGIEVLIVSSGLIFP